MRIKNPLNALFATAVLSTLLVGCSRTDKTTAGIEFRYLKEGDGRIVQPGQFLLLGIRVVDANDSVWIDTWADGGEPQLVRVDEENEELPDPGEIGVYRMLSKGDSVSFKLDVATIFEQTWMQAVPGHLDRDMAVTYVLAVEAVFDEPGVDAFRKTKQEQLERKQMEHRIRQFGSDTLLIDSILNARGKKALRNPSGIRYTVEIEGKGAELRRDDLVSVFYQGYFPNGKIFDTNRTGEPLEVRVGAGKVIRGWDEMLLLMKPGGRYTIYLPSLFAYGERGVPPDVPADAVLIFDMEIVAVKVK